MTASPPPTLYHRWMGWHAPALRRVAILACIGLAVTRLVVADLAQYTSSKPASLRHVELVMRRAGPGWRSSSMPTSRSVQQGEH
jgi:hypothetical protein